MTFLAILEAQSQRNVFFILKVNHFEVTGPYLVDPMLSTSSLGPPLKIFPYELTHLLAMPLFPSSSLSFSWLSDTLL